MLFALRIKFPAVNQVMEVNVNTTSERIPEYRHTPELQTVESQTPQQYLRIGLPQSLLTPQQLLELAGMIRRYSSRYVLRLRSATQLEIAMASTHQIWPSQQLFDEPVAVDSHEEASAGRSTLRVHIPGTQLRVRQLRVLAMLMHSEGLRTVRLADSETLILENVWRGREAVLRLGLREAGLITL